MIFSRKKSKNPNMSSTIKDFVEKNTLSIGIIVLMIAIYIDVIDSR
jgi:uncharacterized membrane protein (DUF441 family)